MSTKGQSNVLSTVLMMTIVVVLVIGAYTWGNSLMDVQETSATVKHVQTKLLELEKAIQEVVHDGKNSTRSVQVDVSKGRLYVEPGEHCTLVAPLETDKNGIVYEISTDSKLIDVQEGDWINIDPYESNANCDAIYMNNSATILLAKTIEIGDSSLNQYMLWSRTLSSDTMDYLINISAGDSSGSSGGRATINVKNKGIVVSGGTTYIGVEVDIEG